MNLTYVDGWCVYIYILIRNSREKQNVEKREFKLENWVKRKPDDDDDDDDTQNWVKFIFILVWDDSKTMHSN
jgi:hypothetical protein